MALDQAGERTRWATVSSTATQIGRMAQSLNEWDKKAGVDCGVLAGIPSVVTAWLKAQQNTATARTRQAYRTAKMSVAARTAEIVAMTMMRVRIMRMCVGERNVLVPVGVRFAGRVTGRMPVPMMLVVNMPVLVIERVMDVRVLVPFDEMQANAESHQERSREQAVCDGLLKDENGENRADERRRRKIGAGAGAAEVTKTTNEEDKRHAIAEESNQRRAHKRH